MSEITVKRMRSGDLAEVKVLEQESSLSTWSLRDYEEEITRKGSICLVARSKEAAPEIAGFLLARMFISTDSPLELSARANSDKSKNRNFAEINNIAVNPVRRRMGIGSKLIDHLISEVKTEVREIWLEVRESNTSAIGFYKDLEFSKQYVRKNYYARPIENAVVMMRTLAWQIKPCH
ncbi:MAG: GNAT family N-acetyltransferase [Pyrinomonadaceae bacterium]